LIDPNAVRSHRVAKVIESYLSRHPDAADNERGIATWWLPSLGEQATVEEVTQALAHLQELGVVEKQVMPDGRALYRASRAPGARSK
jgi:phage baseplate assembly protein gpV